MNGGSLVRTHIVRSHGLEYMEILVVLLFLRFFVMEENEAEEEKADHHRESGGVVRISGDDEPLVLRVLQRSN